MGEYVGQGPPLKSLVIKKAESKERLQGMRKLYRKGLGFTSLENFVNNSAEMGRAGKEQGAEEQEVVRLLMAKKIRDERQNLKKLVKQDKQERNVIKQRHGRRNKGYRKEIKERNKTGEN